jgi:hypothetical protein
VQPKIEIDVLRLLGLKDVELAQRDVFIAGLQARIKTAEAGLKIAEDEVKRLRAKYEPQPPAAGD